jgi:hypothetical protein
MRKVAMFRGNKQSMTMSSLHPVLLISVTPLLCMLSLPEAAIRYFGENIRVKQMFRICKSCKAMSLFDTMGILACSCQNSVPASGRDKSEGEEGKSGHFLFLSHCGNIMSVPSTLVMLITVCILAGHSCGSLTINSNDATCVLCRLLRQNDEQMRDNEVDPSAKIDDSGDCSSQQPSVSVFEIATPHSPDAIDPVAVRDRLNNKNGELC